MKDALKERERIQELLRNKYYWNNYAMVGEDIYKKHHLKERFKLYEMVEEDVDFLNRMQRRLEDIQTLNYNLRMNKFQKTPEYLIPE